MSGANFCTTCGSKLDDSARFCRSCGASTNGGNPTASPFSAMPEPNNQQFQQNQYAPQYNSNMYQPNPVHSVVFEPWKEKNIFRTAIELYKNPERVAPSIILSESGPNPIIFAIITGIFGFIVGVIIKIRFIDPSIHSLLGNNSTTSQFESLINGLEWLFLLRSVGSPLIMMFIGSAFVSLIMKGGFPVGSLEQVNSFEIFRKIWGYLLFGTMISQFLMIPVTALITPRRVDLVTFSLTTLPSEFMIISTILGTIVGVINLITFRRIAKSINNQGDGLTIVTLIWVLIIFYPLTYVGVFYPY